MHGHWVVPGGATALAAAPRSAPGGEPARVGRVRRGAAHVSRPAWPGPSSRDAGWVTACSEDLRRRAPRTRRDRPNAARSCPTAWTRRASAAHADVERRCRAALGLPRRRRGRPRRRAPRAKEGIRVPDRRRGPARRRGPTRHARAGRRRRPRRTELRERADAAVGCPARRFPGVVAHDRGRAATSRRRTSSWCRRSATMPATWTACRTWCWRPWRPARPWWRRPPAASARSSAIGETGLLVAERDRTALAAAIDGAARRRLARGSLGEAARREATPLRVGSRGRARSSGPTTCRRGPAGTALGMWPGPCRPPCGQLAGLTASMVRFVVCDAAATASKSRPG